MVPWNSARTKVQIKLSIQRLRTLQEKKMALAKKSRREIADLLLKNRVETARLRVEGLIQDDIYVELLELLELYSELLQARFNLLDASSGTEPEASISDAVCAIVYAAPRTELKELQVLREMLMHKYGRAFSLSLQTVEPPPLTVPARVRSKLALYTPERELVDAYLYEIAKGYNVNWVPEPPTTSDTSTTADEGPAGGVKEKLKEAIEGSDDMKDTEEQGEEGAAKKVDYPADSGKDVWAGDAPPSLSAPTTTPKGNGGTTRKLTPEEELAQRFERLKKL